jgi:predicted lipoprotein with Yx(FWY)xxD motif
MTRSSKRIILLAIAGLGLAACGASNDSPSVAPTQAPAAPQTTVAAAPATTAATVAVKTSNSPLGQILVGPDGRTLYAFTNDVDARSSCTGTCADAWPPVIVDDSWIVAPGLDSGVFSTTERPDGGEQLVAGKFPLYYFSGDSSPGEVNGQGSGDVWFVVDTKAALIKAATPAQAPATTAAPAPVTTAPPATAAPATAAPATTAAPAPATTAAPAKPASAPVAKVSSSPLGQILVDPAGRTMYAFTKDADGKPTCNDACAKAWPPVIVNGPIAVEGADGKLFTTVARADGSSQLKAGKWPLYYFAGDAAPGDTNGQGSGNSWFVVGADAKLIK